MKQQTKRTIAISIAIVLIAAVLIWLIVGAAKGTNAICLFAHNYDDSGKCIRCGKDKPIENEDEPKAALSERFVFASAQQLTASNRASDVPSYIPAGCRKLAVGDVITSGETIYIDVYAHDYSGHQKEFDGTLIYTTNQGEVYFCTGDFLADSSHYITYYTVYNGEYMPDWSSMQIEDPWEYADGFIQDGQKVVELRLDSYSHLGTITQVADNLYIEDIQELPPDPVKTGYTFTGWYTDEACTNKYTASTVTSDITLYAGFRAHTYSIKFNANSGSGNMENLSMTYDQSKALTTNAFTEDHFAFKGWATSADGDVVYSNGQSVKNLTATDGAVIELFAVWERSEVAVMFVADGKSTTTWIAIGTKATLPENPTKEGHTFVGWNMADGSKYIYQNLSEDTTLTAEFKVIRCTVTFVVDGEVYATYVCDWGTKLAEALKANELNNPLLVSVEDEYSRNF